MKEWSMIVTNVIIKVLINGFWSVIWNQNLKVLGILVNIVDIKHKDKINWSIIVDQNITFNFPYNSYYQTIQYWNNLLDMKIPSIVFIMSDMNSIIVSNNPFMKTQYCLISRL